MTGVLVLVTVGVLMEAHAWWQVLIGALAAADTSVIATLLLLYLPASRLRDK